MRKDALRDYATQAFVTYASLGCPTDEEFAKTVHTAKASKEYDSRLALYADICAINKMFEMLEREGKDYVAAAVRAVYMFVPRGSLSSSEIKVRVTAHAMATHADFRTVYRWLQYARTEFGKHRGLTLPDN